MSDIFYFSINLPNGYESGPASNTTNPTKLEDCHFDDSNEGWAEAKDQEWNVSECASDDDCCDSGLTEKTPEYFTEIITNSGQFHVVRGWVEDINNEIKGSAGLDCVFYKQYPKNAMLIIPANNIESVQEVIDDRF